MGKRVAEIHGEEGDGSKRSKPSFEPSWEKGTLLTGMVLKKASENNRILMVLVAPHFTVKVRMTEVEDEENWVKDPFAKFKESQFVHCVLVKSPESKREGKFAEATMRPSIVNLALESSPLSKSVVDKELTSATRYPGVGELVKGYVEDVNKAGVFLRISRGILALVPRRHLSDSFVSDAEKAFPVGTLAVGRVLESNEEKGEVHLSLKSSVVIGDTGNFKFEDIEEGMKLDGTVVTVKDFGLFIQLNDAPSIVGLCHFTNIADKNSTEALLDDFKAGDSVRVFVSKVVAEKRRLGLSLKPSHFADERKESVALDSNSDSSDSDDSDEDLEGVSSSAKLLEHLSDSSDEDEDSNGEDDGESDEEDDSDSGEENEQSSGEEEPKKQNGVLSLQEALKKTKGNSKSWDIVNPKGQKDDAEEDDDDSSDDSGDDQKQDKSKRHSKAKEKKKRMEEAELIARENSKLENDQSPQSVDDFERLVMGMPNSSLLWIQYMAFQTAQTEIDLARAIAERALSTINFREEEEKQNVWFALMELEYKFGTQKQVEEVIKRLLCHMEPKHAYIRIAEMYEAGKEIDKADDALRKAVKAKKGESKKAWVKRIELKFNNGDVEGARSILHAALKSLPEKKHMFVFLTFARLEFSLPEKGGSKERARTMCEELVGRAPKRNDLWHQYIDLETKFGGGDKNRVRQLFERVTSVKMSVKKIKAFFKKWLTYESNNGSEEEVENVKARARSYVQSLTSAQ